MLSIQKNMDGTWTLDIQINYKDENNSSFKLSGTFKEVENNPDTVPVFSMKAHFSGENPEK